jgi:hypothetical protein
METQSINGHARDKEEQGVTSASLRLTLPITHFVRNGGDALVGVRTHCVSMRVNEDELARLKADAQGHHQRMGALLRTSYFDGGMVHVPAINVEKWQALADTLADLQRLAFGLNAGQLPSDMRSVLAETIEQVHELRADLVGQTTKGESDEA